MSGWLQSESNGAQSQATSGDMTNPDAPTIATKKKRQRVSKTFRVLPEHLRAYDQMVFDNKRNGGPTGPELIEEALNTMFEKYGIDPNKL